MNLFITTKKRLDEKLKKFNVSEAELKQFIGPNADYYLSAKDKITTIGWHWPAFLITFTWLGYRKQYQLAVLFIVLTIVGGAVTQYILIIFAALDCRYFYLF
jgi:Protein of unknown function (DUF2628)